MRDPRHRRLINKRIPVADAALLDEPFTLYGLIAQIDPETDDARSYVIFRLNPQAQFSDGVPVSAADDAIHLRSPQAEGSAAAA